MNRRGTASSICALLLSLATAAMAQQIETTVDRNTDFSKYRTFSIEIATSWGNPIGEKNLLEELTKAFVAKGWTLDTSGSPDARILVHGATKEKQRLDTFYTGGYGGYYGGWGWGGVGSSSTTVSEYTEGTLVVDIFDAASKALIWRGVAQAELKVKQHKREKQATKAVTKLLRDFPPKPSTGKG
jgi:uncharacterized protein DUF4136